MGVIKVSKRYQMCLGLNFSSCRHALSILGPLMYYSRGMSFRLPVLWSDSLELSFIRLPFCQEISRAFLIFSRYSWSCCRYHQWLIALSMTFWPVFKCTLSPKKSDSSGVLYVLSCRSSLLRSVMQSVSIEGCSQNGQICDLEYRMIVPS